jgi:DNA-directed RNA polymerase subunit delta
MKRVIVDYAKLTHEILNLLVERFPDGYDDSNIIRFRNAKNELIEAVEVKTEDELADEIEPIIPMKEIEEDEEESDDEEYDNFDDKPETDEEDSDSEDKEDLEEDYEDEDDEEGDK